nr:DMT family transporter [Pseudobdellovibrionaceae bacterium]
MKYSPSTQAAVELFFTSILWGFGFVAAIWALEIFTPPELLFLRFIMAFIVGEVFTWIFKKNQITPHEVKEGLIAGFILGIVLLLQTWGLLYTTATKSGFITSLYVVLIPLFLHFFWKQKTSPSTYINVAFALLGMVILISPDPQSVDLLFMNRGDLLTLLCAVFAAFHIIYIDLKSKKITNGFQFNNYQSLGAAIFCIPSLIQQGLSKGSVFNFKSYSI